MSKRILVLGGFGYIGSNVCKLLSDEGLSVSAIGHVSIPKCRLSTQDFGQWVEADITCSNLEKYFSGVDFDAIIHCAGSGEVSFSIQQPAEDYSRNVLTVLAGLEFIRRSNCSGIRFILTSSAAVYGDQHEVLTEKSKTIPISPYGRHKLSAESLCLEYNQLFDVKCSIVRLFSVYGEGLRKQLLWEATRKFLDGKPEFFGAGVEMRDWIHIEDAAQLIVSAALKSQEDFEIYNGCNSQQSVNEVLNLLAGNLGINLSPVFTNQIHECNPSNLLGCNDKAKQVLSWLPDVSLDSGIRRYANWIRDIYDFT